MKKVILLFFTLLLLSSCSKMDQEILSEGMWKHCGGVGIGTDFLVFSDGGTSRLRNDTIFIYGKPIGLSGYYNLFNDEIVIYSLSGNSKSYYKRR